MRMTFSVLPWPAAVAASVNSSDREATVMWWLIFKLNSSETSWVRIASSAQPWVEYPLEAPERAWGRMRMIANNNYSTQQDDFGGSGSDQHVFPQDCAPEAARTQG
jgi:hypothetical protein